MSGAIEPEIRERIRESPVNRRRLIPSLVLSALLLTGCQSWSRVDMSPEAFLTEETPDRVRVTRADGEQLVLEAPVVRAGAIVATAAPGAVLIEEIQALEVRRTDLLRTTLFALPTALVVALIAFTVNGI